MLILQGISYKLYSDWNRYGEGVAFLGPTPPEGVESEYNISPSQSAMYFLKSGGQESIWSG